MMTRPLPKRRAAPPRRGMSLVEVIVAVTVLAVAMAFVGHLSVAISQWNKANDLIAKRAFAAQQQTNIVDALPYASLTSSLLPSARTILAGDFTYQRQITLASSGRTTAVTIVIVPQTGVPADTLKKETLTIVRTSPSCGTVLNVIAC